MINMFKEVIMRSVTKRMIEELKIKNIYEPYFCNFIIYLHMHIKN